MFDDADVKLAIATIVQALVAMNGQFFVTGSRVLVQRSVANTLRASLIAAYAEIKVGTSKDPSAQLGPLIDKKSVHRIN